MIYGIEAADDPFFPTPGNPAIFIAVGSDDSQSVPVLMTTEDADATTWVDRSAAAATVAPTTFLSDVCYSPSLDRWVAAGYDSSSSFGDPRVIYSDDGGNTWTAATAAPSTDFMIETICWNGTTFIAAGHNSAFGTSRVMTSTDGVTWTSRTAASTTTNWYGGGGTAGLSVIVGASPGRINTSTDNGTSWTARAPSSTANLGQLRAAVCISGGTHVLAGLTSTSTRGAIITSTDGTTWTTLTSGLPSDQQYYGVAYNGSIYVAVGQDFNTNVEGRVASSTAPASTWTQRTGDPNGPVNTSDGPMWLSVAAINGGGFVAVGHDNNGWNIPYLMYSADGITWTARTPDPSSNCILNGVAAGPP